MAQIEIGCGQITWNQFRPRGDDGAAFEERVIAEIAQAGYAGAPAGPRSGQSVQSTLDSYACYGLKPAPGYLGADFWRADQRDTILQQARRYAAFMREAGCSELYVAAGGFGSYTTQRGQTRAQLAAHVRSEDAMSDDEFQRFADTLNEVGTITLREGVRSCFHNHVGTVIETRDEIDRLFGLVDPAVVFMGPDTGHLAWAGIDVVQFCRDYAERIKTIHVKDIDAAVRDRGSAAGWDYGTFGRNGVFVELGEGCVELPAVFEILRGAGFGQDSVGWVIVETDCTQKPSAPESARVSRAYLRSLGL